ncbi:MAG: hypothetical protein DME40_04655 [Verrucomicrobia bacterium]|nr:MAG: hypothetical protein DME40_04655 [Verrucomicrobiota bacterium]
MRLQTFLFLCLGPLLIACAYQGTIVQKAGLCPSRTVSGSMPVSNSLFVTVLATFAGNSFPPRYSIRIGSAIISMTKVQRRRSIAAVRPMERKCSVLPFTKPFQFLFPVFSRFRWSRARYACRILTPLRGTSALSRNSGCSNGADVYDCAVSFGRAYFGLRWQAQRDAALLSCALREFAHPT